MTYNTGVDTYIADAAGFAKPILEHLRKLVHQHCPDVDEAIKWSLPHFDYKGANMCVMASYKAHCSFTFLKATLMTDPRLNTSMELKPIQRYLGKITKMADLPTDDEFAAMLKEAMQLNESGIKPQRPKPTTDQPKIMEGPTICLPP